MNPQKPNFLIQFPTFIFGFAAPLSCWPVLRRAACSCSARAGAKRFTSLGHELQMLGTAVWSPNLGILCEAQRKMIQGTTDGRSNLRPVLTLMLTGPLGSVMVNRP